MGVLLLIIGFLAAIPTLWTIGLILTAVGAILTLAGATGRRVSGRTHYW